MQLAFWQTCQNAIKCHEMTKVKHHATEQEEHGQVTLDVKESLLPVFEPDKAEIVDLDHLQPL